MAFRSAASTIVAPAIARGAAIRRTLTTTRRILTRRTRIIVPPLTSTPVRTFHNSPPLCALDAETDDIETTYILPSRQRTRKARSRFELGEVIGSGKFAQVRKAVDSETGEQVAIKIMSKQTCTRAMLEHELEMMESITDDVDHQRYAPFKGSYEDDRNVYFVMELLNGGELFDLVADKGALEEKDTAAFMRKLVFAIAALHREGILHRDIKLENIVLQHRRADGEACTNNFKITDFGFAQKMGQDDSFESPAGTLGYAAPEVLSDRQYGPPCDIWSAGIVMYILLSGYPPFPLAPDDGRGGAPSADAALSAELEAILHGRSPLVWKASLKEPPWDRVSREAKDLLTKMLRVDPSKRLRAEHVLAHPFLQSSKRARSFEYHNFV